MWRTVGSTAMANLLGIFALFFVAFAFYHQCEAYKVVPCKDENKKCPEWVMRGLCKQTSKWHAYMKLNCKKSCEMCPIVYTTGGTAKGAACVFPFLYKGRLYTSCVKQSDKSYWCSTTYNYATGKKWGICLPVGHKETRCDDKKKRECPGWRNQGFCKESSKWYGYMKDNCKKSCGHCARERETFSAIKKKVCKNLETDKQCATWKNSKFCDEDHEYHSYMKKNCEKTCGFCVSSVKEEEKEDKVVATVATKVECKDTETAAQCLDWKNLGYCKSSSEYNGYMKKSCSKTCGFCVSTSTTTTTSASCKDDYDTEKCKQWAEIGECEENPAWMKTNCKKSCDKCSDGSSSGTGTSGTGTGTSGSSGTGTDVTQEKDKATTTINDVYCGLRIKLRVVGGEDAKFGEWPWQIAIANKLTPTKLLCGGSLINKQWVVTASHCFGSPNSNKYSPKDLVVRIGDHNIKLKEGPEIVSDISMIIRHEGYTYGSYNHDITLLKLAKPIEYNQNIKPICLPQPKVAEKTNQVCFVTGWGRVAEYGKTSDVLQEAKVPIVKRDTCQKTVGLISTFSNNMLCAGYEKGGIDACQGDSGGPLVCDNGGRFELVGVVSWGRGCARENSYGVYTKVSNYIDWIKKNIQK